MSVDFNRATGLLILEVVNSNPNGDPDRENDPRQRPNGLGEISPVSVKRKIRDLIEDHDGVFFQSLPEAYIRQADLYCILESRGRDRAAITKEMNDNPNFMTDICQKVLGCRHFWQHLFGGWRQQGVYQDRRGSIRHGPVHLADQHCPPYQYQQGGR